jgi:hypothetical protein
LSSAILLVRGCLGLTFAVAALGKLADPAGLRRTLREFGTPLRLVTPAALLLPLAELAVAVLLLPSPTARLAAAGALALLALFCLAMVQVIRRGEEPDCNCFGKGHSVPVGPSSLARNAVLAALATTVVVAGPGKALGDVHIAASTLGLGVAVGLLAGFCWQLFRQHGRLIRRVRALEHAVSELGNATTAAPQANAEPILMELPETRDRETVGVTDG